MTYRKEEYEANGHEVTIQQVRSPDSRLGADDPSAWIDGRASYCYRAFDHITDPDVSPNMAIGNRIDSLLEDDEKWKAIEVLLSFMTDNDLYFCRECNSFYDYTEAVRENFCDHKCKACHMDDKYCPDNPDGDSHDDICINPNQKHNARVATKYRCRHCGRVRKTTPTG